MTIAESTNRKIAAERLAPPERAMATPAIRRGAGVMHIAYAKTDASTGSTLTCYLDTDGTGTEVTVNFLLSRATNLNAAGPRLQDGDAIIVTNIGGDWYAVQTFFGSEECS